MENKLYLIDDIGDRIEVEYVDGLDSITETLELTDSKAVTFSTSSELRIGGKDTAAYQFILSKFFSCGSFECVGDGLKAEIYFSCCDVTKSFKILPEFIEYCVNKCYFKIQLASDSEAEEKLNCLRDSYFWANGFLDTLTIDDIPQFDWQNPVNNFIGHVPAIPIKKILDFNLSRCGITLVSSILDNPLYANLSLGFDSFQVLPTIFRHGLEVKKPTMDTIDILDRLKVIFNAEYRVRQTINGDYELIFERRDFFTTPLETLVLSDFETNGDELCIGFENDDKQLCKSTSFFYKKAGVTDYVVETSSQYNYLKQWESNPNRTNQCEVEALFHSPAFDETSGLMRYIISDEIDENTPLIFAWDGQDIVNGQVFNTTDCGYNYPLFFVENANCDNLFDQFYYIDDPQILGCNLEVKDNIEIQPKRESDYTFCSITELINKNGLQIAFQVDNFACNNVYIFPSQLSINYSTGTITIEEPIII